MDKVKGSAEIKPYNFVELEDNSVEITMYGNVVQDRPIDFWTGEPIPGLFIVLSEFLQELEKIKEKEQITVRINSGGGELYAAISIYNRLKELKNVITIVDGLAASAASVILQAGKIRKVYAGSQVMIHGASLFLYGSYNIQGLEEKKKSLEAANHAALQSYLERTGLEIEQIKEDMKITSWMTGKEVIEKGYADELIADKKMELMVDQKEATLYVNQIPMCTQMFLEMPKNLKKIEGEEKMDLKELKEKYPNLVQQIQEDGKEQVQNQIDQALQKERERLKAIEEIESIIGDKELVKAAKYGENKMTAQDLAFVAMKKQAELGENFFRNMLEDTKKSGVNQVIVTSSEEEHINSEEDEIKAAAEMIAAGFGGKK
jgi:ATP-dependent protease ClpP protease subunit